MGFRITKYDASPSQLSTISVSTTSSTTLTQGIFEIIGTKEWTACVSATGAGVLEQDNTIDTAFNPFTPILNYDPYLYYTTSLRNIYTRQTISKSSYALNMIVNGVGYLIDRTAKTLIVGDPATRTTTATHNWSDLWSITVPVGYAAVSAGIINDGTYGYGYINIQKSSFPNDYILYLVKFLLSDPTTGPTKIQETAYSANVYFSKLIYNVGDNSLIALFYYIGSNVYIRKYGTDLTYKADYTLGRQPISGDPCFIGDIAPGLAGDYFWLANTSAQVISGSALIYSSKIEKRDSTNGSFASVLGSLDVSAPTQGIAGYIYVPAGFVGTTEELKKGYITFKLEVTPSLTLDALLASSCSNVNFSVLFTASGAEAPYTYTLDNVLSVTPPELTFTDHGDGTATFAGTAPITPGSYRLKFELAANDGETLTFDQSYSIYEAPEITNATALPEGGNGVAYSYSITYTAVNSVLFEIISGLLPPGLTLNSSTGEITGTPTTTGSWSFRLRITDEVTGCTDESDHTITVTGDVAISGTLPSACLGSSYSHTLTAAGGVEPYTWTILSGTLPETLTLNSSTGEVSGTLTDTPGTYSFTVKVQDSGGPAVVGTKNYSITIYNVPTITTVSLPIAYHEAPYNFTLTQTGGDLPVTWALISGTLPTGLSFNTSTGNIYGTPTLIETASLLFRVTSVHGCTDEKAFSLIVEGPPDITSAPPHPVCLAKPFYWQAIASGVNTPITFSITDHLPEGLTFDGTTGIMQGQPTEVGIFPFVLTAIDSHGLITTKGYQIEVYNSPIIQTPYLPVGAVGKYYEFTLALTSGTGTPPFIWLISPLDPFLVYPLLPAGMAFDSVHGTLSGIPQDAGSWGFKISVTDANGCYYEKIYYLQILGYPVIETLSLPPVCAVGSTTNDVSYELLPGSQIIVSGGTPPYYFFVTRGALPTGLTLNPYTGQISGKAVYPGITSTFVIQVVDQNSLVVEKEFSIRVRTRIECGQDEGPTITIVKQRLTSMESDPIVVEDPFHQKHMIEYLPVPMQGGETDNG